MGALSLGGRPGGSGREGTRSPPLTTRVQGISVTLSGAQVRGVLREAAGRSGSRDILLGRVDELRVAVGAALLDPEIDEREVSRSTLRALSIFCAFAPRGTIRGIIDVGRELGVGHSTAYRYAQTLVEVGLLEQVTSARKYRIPPAATDSSEPAT